MTTLLADDFNRTLSGTWGNSSHGEAWTQRLGASNQLSCNGTQGKIDNTTAGRVIMAIGSALSDVEVTVTATPGTSDSEIGVGARLQADNLSYYSFRVNGTAGGALIYRIDNGTATQIAGISAFTLTPGTAYDLKFRVIGSSLRAKVWSHGSAEPGTWLFDITDATYASGGCGVVAVPQNSTGVLFDDFLVTDGGAPVLPQMAPNYFPRNYMIW
ncbi:MAG: hypothetical protein IMW89_22395 [Ktedonobacteraceae bacterium]|nr:hypothetical protein [Ktedonobacteraceae bacterium]